MRTPTIVSQKSFKETSREPIDDLVMMPGRSKLALVVAIICALGISAALFAGYYYLQRRHAEKMRATQQSKASPNLPPEAQIYEDEALLKGAQAVIGGTVVNISQATLANLTVDLELKRRQDGTLETRSVAVEPGELAPDQQGRYSLSISSRDYRGARLLRLRSGARADDVPFKTAPGAQRPPEPPLPTRTIIKRPPPPSGEEFINTPDRPAKVP